MDDEILDLVDTNDVVIGTVLRGDIGKAAAEGRGFVRAVDMFILNDEGKIWIPTRTMDKTIAPGGLDYSMGGHVDSGEDYIDAAIRETDEELNLTITADDVELIKTFRPAETPYFRAFYLCKSNDTPNYNPADFTTAAWYTPEEVLALLDKGVPAKTSMRDSIDTLIEFIS